MQHEFLPLRVKKEIHKISNKGVEPTFSEGSFLPDVVKTLKDHLRKIELAQIRSVQEYKEVIKSRNAGGRPTSKIWQQIEAARKG